MAEKDYYKTLGVQKNATKDEIKKAYKKLAMQFHPDRAPEEKKKEYEEKFKGINEAAAVLSDDKKRQQYDQYGSSAFQQGGAGAGGFEGFDFSDIMSHFRSSMSGDSDDMFEQLFGGGGGGRRSGRARRGSDLLYETEISLEDAFHGTKKTIALNKLEHCTECKGRGAHRFEKCSSCQGSGYLKRTQRTPFGIFQQTGPCGSCQGKGEIPQDSCSTCDGEGVVRRKKEIEITIPAGVQQGMRLRIVQEGEVGAQGGPAGDLYVQIALKEHQVFRREENDVHLTVPISFTQAVMGDEIEVPTLDGKASMKIPAGTSSETVFRMREKGFPDVHGSGELGDQLVKVKIEVPKKLAKKQFELLRQLDEEKPSKGFLKKVFG